VEIELIGQLQQFGLKLKPGAPLDAQILNRHPQEDEFYTRLHYRQSLKRNYDQEAVLRLAKKHPKLKPVIHTQVVSRVDVKALERVLPELPVNIAQQIISFTPIESLNEVTLTDPECLLCGGKMGRDSKCDHCGCSGHRRKRKTATPRVWREKLRGSLSLCMILLFLQPSPLLLLRVAPPLHQLLLSAHRLPHQVRVTMPRNLTTPPQEPKALANFYTRTASELKANQCIISSRICRHPGASRSYVLFLAVAPRLWLLSFESILSLSALRSEGPPVLFNLCNFL